MFKHGIALAFLVVLSSCTLNRLAVSDYSPSGKDKPATDADQAECDKKAENERPSGFSDTLAVETQYNKIFDTCMQTKGYKRR